MVSYKNAVTQNLISFAKSVPVMIISFCVTCIVIGSCSIFCGVPGIVGFPFSAPALEK